MSDADAQLSLIPDFIANCGMARVFAFLMESQDPEITDSAIFKDTSNTIYQSLKNVYDQSPSLTNVSRTAFELALIELTQPESLSTHN
jgi:hypothetical protein